MKILNAIKKSILLTFLIALPPAIMAYTFVIPTDDIGGSSTTEGSGSTGNEPLTGSFNIEDIGNAFAGSGSVIVNGTEARDFFGAGEPNVQIIDGWPVNQWCVGLGGTVFGSNVCDLSTESSAGLTSTSDTLGEQVLADSCNALTGREWKGTYCGVPQIAGGLTYEDVASAFNIKLNSFDGLIGGTKTHFIEMTSLGENIAAINTPPALDGQGTATGNILTNELGKPVIAESEAQASCIDLGGTWDTATLTCNGETRIYTYEVGGGTTGICGEFGGFANFDGQCQDGDNSTPDSYVLDDIIAAGANAGTTFCEAMGGQRFATGDSTGWEGDCGGNSSLIGFGSTYAFTVPGDVETQLLSQHPGITLPPVEVPGSGGGGGGFE